MKKLGLLPLLAALLSACALPPAPPSPEGGAPPATPATPRCLRVEYVHALAKDGGEETFRITRVVDDGVGGADPTRGTGLRGLRDRLEALDGRLDVESSAASGTRISAEIPCS